MFEINQLPYSGKRSINFDELEKSIRDAAISTIGYFGITSKQLLDLIVSNNVTLQLFLQYLR